MPNDRALISVVVPVYNVQEFVDRCLDSICAQTYDNIDVVVVDDGSTDGSGAVCDAWAESDSRVRVFHTENRGLSAARNEGMRHIRGDYVAFVDSDDYIGMRHIENLYRALSEAEAPLAITGSSKAFVSEERRFGLSFVATQTEKTHPHHYLKGMITREGPVDFVAMGKLYSKELFPLLSFPEGRTYEDILVAGKVMNSVQAVVYENANDYFYTVNRSGSITKSCRGLLGYIRELEELRQFVDENIEELRLPMDGRYYSSLVNVCITLAAAVPDSREFQDTFAKVRQAAKLVFDSKVSADIKLKYLMALAGERPFRLFANCVASMYKNSNPDRMLM